MNRRSFLSNPFETAQSAILAAEPIQAPLPAADCTAPVPVTGLTPYTGPWTEIQASHLLRRVLFSVKKNEVREISQEGMAAALARLLAPVPPPAPPLTYENGQMVDVPGATWINLPYNSARNGLYRVPSLKAWWTGLMINQGISLQEKMVLFWHNHFATQIAVYDDARYGYKYNALLRKHAFGNFRTLARDISLNPAMLVYLNSNTNTKTNTNENYARELLELFTIGKGDYIGMDGIYPDYTTYTEQDVKAAAKVLTGWWVNRQDLIPDTDGSYVFRTFAKGNHATGPKQFSYHFNNHVINRTSNTEYELELDDLINMIFSKPATAKHLCKELYKWFVHYDTENAAAVTVIDDMTTLLLASDYEVKPVLEALFGSQFFYDQKLQGCLIRNPIDFTVGICRQFNLQFPATLNHLYNSWTYVRKSAGDMLMDLHDPPNVAGWAAYHQAPQFHQLWINAISYKGRNKYASDYFTGKGVEITYTGTDAGSNVNKYHLFYLKIDPIKFAEEVSDFQAHDINKLIDEMIKLLFPIPITTKQRDELKSDLLGELDDLTWTTEWLLFSNPHTPQYPQQVGTKQAIETRLINVITKMLSMAEHQLS